jgi:hypothetical protein
LCTAADCGTIIPRYRLPATSRPCSSAARRTADAIFLQGTVVGDRHRIARAGGQRRGRSDERAHDLADFVQVDPLEVGAHLGSARQPLHHLLRIDLDSRAGGAEEQQVRLGAREQHCLGKHVDEGPHHRERCLRRDLVRRQPLADIAARPQARARERVELFRVQRPHTGIGDWRRLERNEVVRFPRLHLQVLPPVVDVHRHARVMQHALVAVAEVTRVGEDVAR